MNGLSGGRAKQRATELAARYGTTWQTVYRVTEDQRTRKTRSDAGNRRADLLTDPALLYIAAQVSKHHVSVERAISNAAAKGLHCPYSVGYVRQLLCNLGISRRKNATARAPHRRFEADAPGRLYQVDITGLKTRWADPKTRRLLKVSSLDVSKNHPNENPRRVPVWAFTIVDDYSRFVFTRFVAVEKPTQTEFIDFVLEAFREMGVPFVLYSDNDGVICGKRMQRAARLLGNLFRESGGFELAQHKPGNPQATGKVENLHKYVEECERTIALLNEPTLETLNRYARVICDNKNHKVHATTGVAPIIRWRENNEALRIPPPKTLDDIFQAVEFTVQVRSDVVVCFEGRQWQLPRVSPFIDWAETGKEVLILSPARADHFWIVDADDIHTIQRLEASPDTVGKYANLPKTKSQSVRETLDEVETVNTLSIDEIEAQAKRENAKLPAMLPKPRIEATDAELLAAVGLKPTIRQDEPAQVLPMAAKPVVVETHFSRIQAIQYAQESGYFAVPPTPEQREMIARLFVDKSSITQSELDAALVVPRPRLVAL